MKNSEKRRSGYCVRSDTMGSTRVARHAGMRLAIVAINVRFTVRMAPAPHVNRPEA
ncbi:MAG TPA: hypothetical protein VLV86_21615 [Vicinamibacterales bacterium]|nr:hypothetical protein [Vicinamibacterales bacterium]